MSTRSHFRQMANRLSLAHATNLYGSGLLDLCTSARRYWIPITMKNKLGGFSPPMANTISFLCPPSGSFLILPTFLLSPARLVPLLTSHIQPLALNGSSVTIRRVHLVYYLPHSYHCSNSLICKFVPTLPTFLLCTNLSRCNAL